MPCAGFGLHRAQIPLNIRMDSFNYFIEQHRQIHQKTPRSFNGKSLVEHIELIDRLMKTHNCLNILDYGCGQASYWPDHWTGIISGYDPAVDRFSQEPDAADLVICVDVMEHIPEPHVDMVIQSVFSLSRKHTFFSIGNFLSKKKLPDGTNRHVTAKNKAWWEEKFVHYQNYTLTFGIENEEGHPSAIK
jgi:hypothetical protein